MKWTAKSVGPGWVTLVQPLIDYCEAHDIVIDQIKEKFGTLRFYYHETVGEDPLFKLAVDGAEANSRHMCEECGSWDGKLGPVEEGGYWLKVLCETCRAVGRSPSL